jgi:O-glycosyl hydrolase
MIFRPTHRSSLFLAALLSVTVGAACRAAQAPPDDAAGGAPVLAPTALLTTPVGGLERTNARAEVVSVTGQPFARALRVTVRASAPETNATQLTLPNTAPIQKGDALLASFFVRGSAAGGRSGRAAQTEFLFERSTDPWTKSATQGVVGPADGRTWKRVSVPFTAAETYAPGEAMASLRFAFGPQTVEVGGLSVVNFGKSRTADELIALAARRSPLGTVQVTVRPTETRQTLTGFGGNFAQPRYGVTEPMDSVGRYNLEHLRVVHARVGIPLNTWTPEKGVYKDDGPARAALLQMQEMARRKIPITGSVWEGPQWMLPGTPEQNGRTLAPERYDDCIEAIAQFLVTARDKYGAPVAYFSFNEPDYGVNFKFTPAQMADFIRKAGPRFAALGLRTKFLVADTANGANFPGYARPLLEDKSIAAYLGPLAFHSWDVLGAPDERYAEIAALGRKYKKPVWCTEAGHDAQLWQKPNPWASWENALRTALAYEKTIRVAEAAQIDYWTYQNNYPLVKPNGSPEPYPVFHVVRQMENALPRGAKIVATKSDNENLHALASVGPRRDQFSVVLVNPAGAGRVIVAGLPPGAAVSVTSSDAEAPSRAPSRQRVDASGRLTVSLTPRSVVTVRAQQ